MIQQTGGLQSSNKSKTFFFLGGLPRSGNTVLSALLNQNPLIYSGLLSPVCNIMWNTKQECFREPIATHPNTKNLDNVISGIIENYYSDIKKPYIFDREKCWGTPPNFELILEYITPNPKIVLTVRSIPEILLSFLNVLDENSYIDREMNQISFLPKIYKNQNDARCDYLMLPDGTIGKSLLGIYLATKDEYKKFFHIIEYNDLINNKKETMKNLYDFLEIEHFEHDFFDIKTKEIVDDEKLGYPKDLHKVHKVLKKQTHNKNIVLSDYVLNRYSNLEFWRK